MGFPNSPTNGQEVTVNGVRYSYNSSLTAFVRVPVVKWTSSTTPPANPSAGDKWYATNTDILYEYIYDSVSSYWVDVQSLGQTGNITNIGNSTLAGNIVVGVNALYNIGAGNGYINNFYANNIVGNTVSTNANLSVAGNLIQTQAFYETYGNVTATGGNLTCNFNLGAIFNVNSITANVTANFTNVNAITNSVTGATVVINQGATAYTISNLQINGVQQTIRWIGGYGTGAAPIGLANNTDVISFSMIHLGSGTFRILGQLSSYA